MGLSELPLACGTDHKKAFEKFGWVERRTGNHIIMTHSHFENPISIPNHKEVKRTTLKTILRSIGVTDAQYRVFFDS
jgi:predicted RNA binding protein YcfA (HicA-like mRNA interferase family)